MGHSKKIKPLSKKTATSLIKNETPNDLEKSEIFGKETKAQMLSDIKEGKRLSLLQQVDTKKDWKPLKRKLQRSRKASVYWKYGAAASVLIIVALTVFLNKGRETPFSEPLIVNNNIKIGSDKATLTLADGSEVTLEKGTAYQTNYISSNGEEIVYHKATKNQQPTTNNHTVYNTLTIPRGGQFFVELSDGTQVWLNSESQLKYPVAFNNGETRQVELVYGEAYFDVSPSTTHQGAKFKVFNQSQEVEVLGTEFNIKAYKDESHIYTTLVEGKVAISTANTNQILVPNQQSNLNIETNNISMTTVDVDIEISWKDGVFDFSKMPLKDIMTVLSRWYDVDVIFENKALEAIIFTGALGKDQSLEDILSALKSTNFINGYKINNKMLTLE
ncbi:MAG: FecR domain-containing protein [Algibacter sp.]